MALDRLSQVTNSGISTTISFRSAGINVTGVVTATTFVGALTGNVTGTVSSSGIATFSGGVVVSAGTTALPSISPSGDSNTGVFFPAADTISASTGGTSRITIDSSGNITVTNNLIIPLGTSLLPSLAFLSDPNTGLFSPGADTLALVTAGTNRLHITSAGLVGIGDSGPDARLTVKSSGASTTPLNVKNSSGTEIFRVFQAAGGGSQTSFKDASGNTNIFIDGAAGQVGIGTTTVSGILDAETSSDTYINFSTTNSGAAAGLCLLAGTSNQEFIGYRNQLRFGTITGKNAASFSERCRLDSSGRLLVGKTATAFATSGTEFPAAGGMDATRNGILLSLNRITTDGNLIDFYQDSVLEGNINVSGSNVTLSGAHLSRWSQLPGGADRIEILRGSVLSNLDEMCEWGEEDNEQLNRMKISTVEGDKNVSGVFQTWDDDDDTYTNDFYCAMTGDFIIRIAEGITVERGDLLMSAGDGTAKPQDDDIIRSKTIAKVTSANVSCSYEDGSYCVPCVLMAC